LGERLEYIVVKSKSAMERAVTYLKENDKGKAGFVITDKNSAKKEGAYDSHFADIIKISDELKPALGGFFAGIRYVEKFADAINCSDSGTCVTKDGT